MLLTSEEAKTKECVGLPPAIPEGVNSRMAMMMLAKGPKMCIGDQCAAFWLWLDGTKTVGYCSRCGVTPAA